MGDAECSWAENRHFCHIWKVSLGDELPVTRGMGAELKFTLVGGRLLTISDISGYS